MKPEVALREPIARRIFDEALNRLDRVPVDARTNAIRIPIDASRAPEIFEADTAGDRDLAWHVLEVLATAGFGSIEFDKPVKYGAPFERKPKFVVASESEQRLRDAYERPRPGISYARAWAHLAEASPLSEQAKHVVGRSPISIEGRTPEEVFGRLLWICEQFQANHGALLREISAKAFWGLSKVLDARQELLASLLDLDECPFPEQPIHINVFFAGPYNRKLIFIENKTSFERAIRDYREATATGMRSPYQGAALLFSSGYMGSAKRLRRQQNVRPFYALDHVSVPDSVNIFVADFFSETDLPTWFWGDLDYAGMNILLRLKENFPSAAAWQEGYAPMLAELEAGGGHTPAEAGKEGQRPIVTTGCNYSDSELIPAMMRTGRFVDQEGFRVRQSETLGK